MIPLRGSQAAAAAAAAAAEAAAAEAEAAAAAKTTEAADTEPSKATDPSAVVLRDNRDYIPLRRLLSSLDIIVLLTPVAVPPPGAPLGSGDPFEILGRALARRHPFVRHVPYTKQGGLTGTHVAFIRRAQLVIFVISGQAGPGQRSQVDLAELSRAIAEARPQVLVVCANPLPPDLLDGPFPAIVQSNGYTLSELESVASLMFGGGSEEPTPSTPPPPPAAVAAAAPPLSPPPASPPRQWHVASWHPHCDMQPMYDLWCKVLPPKYHVNRFLFGTLIRRDGWAKHWVVKDGDRIVGFCITYTTYGDSDPENLIGSLAMLMVHDAYRNQGIGTLLHNHALAQLRRTRGVCRLQLGTTFPRLLYGIPTDMLSAPWFRSRGWDIDFDAPGQGQAVTDWLLRFDTIPATTGLASVPGLTFRLCELDEFQRVMDVVQAETAQHRYMMGWFDQYSKLDGTMEIQNIMLGLDSDAGGRIVATAVTYEANSPTVAGQDIPWPGTLQGRVGGVTCICVPDDVPAKCSRDSIILRLLDACVRSLRSRDCTAMFLDSIRGGHDALQSLGFHEWAEYREVWKDM